MEPKPIPRTIQEELTSLLDQLYGDVARAELFHQITTLMNSHQLKLTPPPTAGDLTEKDSVLITYPDIVRESGEQPMAVLKHFLSSHLMGIIDAVHLLPFFPSSSDDGFSVVDYRAVDPELGDWNHIEAIAEDFRLMADAVINHVSKESEWFQSYLRGIPQYQDYFLTVDPTADLSKVVRPRDLPLLTPFATNTGTEHLWTTFSSDQVDLNYQNPKVLIEVLTILLDYIKHGIQILRLDAIAFLWKEVGTPSIHLPQTHMIIRLIRMVLEWAAPWVILITETNVPHEENITYFGDGHNEAHLIYQFPLPPLTLHTFLSKNSTALTQWAMDLQPPSRNTGFFNFLASHDGIGLRPAADLLTGDQIDHLVHITSERGGGVTHRETQGQGRQPYELNINLMNALSTPDELSRNPGKALRRFLCAHSILLTLQGVPGLYFHSLVGSQNDLAGVERTGRWRSINRQKLNRQKLELELASPSSLRHGTYHGLVQLLSARRRHPAFAPSSSQSILDLGPSIFALRRTAHDGSETITAIHEVMGKRQQVAIPESKGLVWFDVFSGKQVDPAAIPLNSWGYRWLVAELSPAHG